MSEKMTDDELNERLAKALGWKTGASYGLGYVIRHDGTWMGLGHSNGVEEFSPATSTDDLRAYVLPEVERRGLWDDFVLSLAHPWLQNHPDMRWERFVLTTKPRTLAEAALKVLEADDE